VTCARVTTRGAVRSKLILKAGPVPGDVLIAPKDAVLAKTTYRDWLTR
jgi:hypothetical protein